MAEQRLIIEMGMGNDLHGQDYTKAAKRAVEDAFRHSSLPLFGVTDLSHNEMQVKVTVAVQAPGEVDADAVKSILPRGQVDVHVVAGGLNVETDAGGPIVIAQASVEAFLPTQTRWRLKA